MLLGKARKIVFTMIVVLFAATAFAATNNLGAKFLDKAEQAMEDGNTVDAYKYVNQALAVTKDEAEAANILYFAQTVYTQRLKELQASYDEMALIDIQTNLDKYPRVENTTIKRLVKQIQSAQSNKEKAEQQQRQDAQIKQMQQSTNTMKEFAEVAKENNEIQKESQELIKEGFEEQRKTTEAQQREQNRKLMVIIFAVIGIAVIILIVILLVGFIAKKGFKQQEMQHEQYVQAFKLLAANQSQTNRIMLGGITDLYGSNPTLRLAGTSTWAPAAALPDVDLSETDEEELKQLAVKCEEIGTKIDQATGRKNNSKNVSELVYKLSMQLGLPSGLAMLNFCAAMVYDAGFLGIDPELLSATDLTDEQKKALQGHVALAEKHLDFVPKKYWSIFEDAATKHHENIDGSGYPKGLKGDEIPQIARLIHVAESYVSLSSRRNYRQTMDKETAIQKLKEQPDLYDTMVVDVLNEIV